MKRTLFVLALVAALLTGCGGLKKMKSKSDKVRYQAIPNPVATMDDKVVVNFTGQVPPKYFNKNCAVGIKANKEKMHHNLHNSLMLVTALNPYIGYENAAKTAKKAFKDNISLKEACVQLGFLSEEKFDEVFHPEEMV